LPRLEGALDLSVGVPLGDVAALVAQLLTPPQSDLDLGPAVLEVETCRHERQASLAHPTGETIDLAPVEQQLAIPLRIVVRDATLVIGGDVETDEPELTTALLGESLLKRDPPLAQRLHLGAREHEACFDALEQLVLVTGTPVVGDQPRALLSDHSRCSGLHSGEQPPRQHRQHRHRQLRLDLEKSTEVVTTDGQAANVRRRANPTYSMGIRDEQRELTDELARAELDGRPASYLDRNRPFLHDEHSRSRVVCTAEHRAGGHLELRREPGDQRKRIVRELGEERDVPQLLRVSHDAHEEFISRREPAGTSEAGARRYNDRHACGMRVLIVEDEDAIAEPLADGLRDEGFDVERVSTGEDALVATEPDLVLLDIRLPGIDGLDVCRALRTRSDVPIIMLTAKGEEVDKVVGLELGADDYLVKPFGFRELLARIHAVTRRATGVPTRAVVEAGDLTIDLRGRTVSVGGQAIELTPKEFDLLALLAGDPGAVFTKAQILEEVWQTTWYGSAKTIDVHVASLRRKLGDPTLIETVRGVGLRLRASA
jgi:two-component system response regulator RegX3